MSIVVQVMPTRHPVPALDVVPLVRMDDDAGDEHACDSERGGGAVCCDAVRVFLDIDGVLLGTDRCRPSRLALADHALDLIDFALARAEVFWLSPRCRGDARVAVEHLVQHASQSDRERLLTLAARVRATDYRELRTEVLPADGRFVWLDDEPSPAELAALRARGWLERWVWVDTREEPEDLLRARQVLARRLGGAAAM